MSSQRFGPKPPKDEHGGGDYHDADTHETRRDKTLLPRQPSMAYRRDWRKGRCTENCSERGDEPIYVGAVKSCPVCGRLYRWRQPHLGPDSSQRYQEGPVHHTLQVSGEPHAHVGEMLLRE